MNRAINNTFHMSKLKVGRLMQVCIRKKSQSAPQGGSNHLKQRINGFFKRCNEYKGLMVLLIPGIAYFIIFHYIPMYGITIAFKDFKFMRGIIGSEWIGFDNIVKIFDNPYVFQVLKNTLIISILKIICGFPAPIIFALLLSEVKNLPYKKIVQTASYLPNFISWVIMAGIFTQLLSMNGPFNGIRKFFGLEPILFMGEKDTFVSLLVITDIWKGFGWGSIIYFASISGINPSLYESAVIDGANRFQQAIYITLPCLVPVVTILLTLSVGGVLNAGFDQIINMQNSAVIGVSDILDTYIFRKGIQEYEYSFTTAVGFLKSIVAIVLITLSNMAARAMGNDYTLW